MDRVAEQDTVEAALITGEELYEMGDIGRCELVEGRIRRMSPSNDRHGGVEGEVFAALHAYDRIHDLGRVRVGEVGIYTRRNPDTVRGADALFISHERYAAKTSASVLDVAPDLVAEVMSPSDRWSEVMQKLRECFGIGVRLVWVVDPAARIVHVDRSPSDVRELTEADELSGDDVLPGFTVPVAQIFEAG
jgi:Uma2 family endonuclease